MKQTIEEILEEYKGFVRAKASLFFVLGAEKDDLVQEGMIGLVKAYNSFDESKGASFKTYADLCITREMLSAVKTAGRKKNAPLNEAVSLDKPVEDESNLTLGEVLVSDSSTDPEAAALYGELLKLVMENSENIFSELEQQVIGFLIQGLGYKEIAAALDKTPKQIDNTMQRIRTKLKEIIG